MQRRLVVAAAKDYQMALLPAVVLGVEPTAQDEVTSIVTITKKPTSKLGIPYSCLSSP